MEEGKERKGERKGAIGREGEKERDWKGGRDWEGETGRERTERKGERCTSNKCIHTSLIMMNNHSCCSRH